jgi:hypothetical protein
MPADCDFLSVRLLRTRVRSSILESGFRPEQWRLAFDKQAEVQSRGSNEGTRSLIFSGTHPAGRPQDSLNRVCRFFA